MGIFNKIKDYFATKAYELGMAEAHAKFLLDDSGEFNLDIMECYDENFALQHIVPFIQDYASDATIEEYNNLTLYRFNYNGTNWNSFIFKHYPKVATIGLPICFIIKPGEEKELDEFCNNINKHDLIHQIGYSVDENMQVTMILYRQALFVDSLGDAETFSQILNEMSEYVTDLFNWDRLADLNRNTLVGILNVPYANKWQQYAIKHKAICGAEQILYPHQKNNGVLYSFTSKCKVLFENNELKKIQPFQIVGDGCQIHWQGSVYLEGALKIEDYNYTFYKDFPYIYTLNATLVKPTGKKLDEDKIKQIARLFNVNPHFTLTKIVYDKSSNGEVIAKIIMSALDAGDGNTRTTLDILGTMKKLIGFVTINSLYNN